MSIEEQGNEPSGVWPPPPTDQPPRVPVQQVPSFPRLSALLLVLLHVATLGIFSMYWIYRLMMVSNARLKRTVISPLSLIMVVAIWAVNFGIGFIKGRAVGISLNPNDLQLFIGVVWLIVAFMLRNGVNEALGVLDHDRAYIGKVGTFFLSLFYIQHKINVYYKLNPKAV